MSIEQYFGINPEKAFPPQITPPLPHKDEITAAQLQFFDNSSNTRKKGQSRYSLKLELYSQPSGSTFASPIGGESSS
jgi:hypothetical protein